MDFLVEARQSHPHLNQRTPSRECSNTPKRRLQNKRIPIHQFNLISNERHNTNERNIMSYNWHSNDFNQKLREYERYLDDLMEKSQGYEEEEELEYDPLVYMDEEEIERRRL